MAKQLNKFIKKFSNKTSIPGNTISKGLQMFESCVHETLTTPIPELSSIDLCVFSFCRGLVPAGLRGGVAPAGRQRRRESPDVAVDARPQCAAVALAGRAAGRPVDSVAAHVRADNGRQSAVRVAAAHHGAPGPDLCDAVRRVQLRAGRRQSVADRVCRSQWWVLRLILLVYFAFSPVFQPPPRPPRVCDCVMGSGRKGLFNTF